MSRREWAKRLNDQWDRLRETAVEGFIALGRDLRVCRKELDLAGYGKGFEKWGEWCKAELDFGYSVASSLVAISKWVDERQISVNDRKLLPPDFNTIDKLTRFDDATFKRLLDDGTICTRLPPRSKEARRAPHRRADGGHAEGDGNAGATVVARSRSRQKAQNRQGNENPTGF